MHSQQPTLTWPSNLDIRWHKKVFDDRFSRWLQRYVGDPVCRDPPARGHHTGFICRGVPSPIGAAGERPEIEIKPPLAAPFLIFPRGDHLKSFLHRDTSER